MNTLLVCDAGQSVLGTVGHGKRSACAYTCFGWRAGAPTTVASGLRGQCAEPITDRYHLGHGHRVYDPLLMRLHSADSLSPFGKGGLNAYAYCLADPVNYHDPEGRFAVGLIGAVKQAGSVFGHARRIHQSLFVARPSGLLGIARVATDVGYVGMAAGAIMRTVGFAAGDSVLNLGVVLLATGKSLRKLDKVVKTIKRHRHWRMPWRRNTATGSPSGGQAASGSGHHTVIDMGDGGLPGVPGTPARDRANGLRRGSSPAVIVSAEVRQ